MKIFLLSSSYIEDLLIIFLCNIFENVFLLKENHSDSEYSLEKIILVQNYSDAIKAADFVLVINDGFYSNEIHNAINYACTQESKKLIVKKYDRKNESKDIKDLYPVFTNYSIAPTILIFECGNYAQIEKIEINLNNFLVNKSIKLHHFFSDKCSSLIENINNEILQLKQYVDNEYDIALFSFDNNFIINNSESLTSIPQKISPDVTICCVESDSYQYEELINTFKYKYDIKIDCIIKSEYFTYTDTGNDFSIKYNLFDNKNDISIPILYSQDKKLYDQIFSIIENKLIFPDNIVVI